MNEIGEILKEARIEKGYTLDDLQQITKIQKRYLEAIEQGNIDILPGGFYARAFIKQYADIVGLDGEELLDEHMPKSTQKANEELAEKVNVPVSRTKVKRSGILDEISEHLPTILIFLLVAAILIGIYFAFRQMDTVDETQPPIINEQSNSEVVPPSDEGEEADADQDENSEDSETETEDETNETDETDEETTDTQEITLVNSTGANTTYEIAGPHPEEQTVVLTAIGGDTWVSITVQGGASESGLLTDGQSLSVTFGPETSQVDLVIGNAPVTEVSLNDVELQYAPEAAGVVRQDWHLQFTE